VKREGVTKCLSLKGSINQTLFSTQQIAVQ